MAIICCAKMFLAGKQKLQNGVVSRKVPRARQNASAVAELQSIPKTALLATRLTCTTTASEVCMLAYIVKTRDQRHWLEKLPYRGSIRRPNLPQCSLRRMLCVCEVFPTNAFGSKLHSRNKGKCMLVCRCGKRHHVDVALPWFHPIK